MEISQYHRKINSFRSINESNYIFACQAAVPIVLTSDLLYHLWNNFKTYQYIFDLKNSFKISHFSVSDLLLSNLCQEVGFEIYELEKKVRDILLEDLVLNLGEKRRNTIAAFLEEYANLVYRQNYRKNLADIHLLTALSFLNPFEMERQIVDKINNAKTDSEKINYLSLHDNLIPVGYESDLRQISKEIINVRNNASIGPILIAENDSRVPGVLKIELPSVLKSKIRRRYESTSLEIAANPWQTLTSRTVYENPWMAVRHEDVINPGGGKGIYGVVHMKSKATGVIPIDEEGNTYLVGQYRYTLNEYSWEIPEGGSPLDSDPLESAKRELKEETGFTAAKWTTISRIHTSNSLTDEEGFIYLAQELTAGQDEPEESEDLRVWKLPLREAIDMVMDNRITDSISVAGLLKAARLLGV